MTPVTPRLRTLIDAINAKGGGYHMLEFSDGSRINGDYDMRQYLHFYDIPDDLSGKKALDIGTAGGFFALDMARRGASVTAIDIWDWDPVQEIGQENGYDITYYQKSVYELDAEFGQFDIVVCGSLILHLPNPFGVIEAVSSVCRGRAIVATSCPADSATEVRPICEFVGQRADDGPYWSYWTIGAEALRRMFLAAGFSSTSEPKHFWLKTEAERIAFDTFHVSMSAEK